MILLTTDQARVLHAVLTMGPGVTALMSESDKEHLERAKHRLASHVHALVESMHAAGQFDGKEPA